MTNEDILEEPKDETPQATHTTPFIILTVWYAIVIIIAVMTVWLTDDRLLSLDEINKISSEEKKLTYLEQAHNNNSTVLLTKQKANLNFNYYPDFTIKQSNKIIFLLSIRQYTTSFILKEPSTRLIKYNKMNVYDSIIEISDYKDNLYCIALNRKPYKILKSQITKDTEIYVFKILDQEQFPKMNLANQILYLKSINDFNKKCIFIKTTFSDDMKKYNLYQQFYNQDLQSRNLNPINNDNILFFFIITDYIKNINSSTIQYGSYNAETDLILRLTDYNNIEYYIVKKNDQYIKIAENKIKNTDIVCVYPVN